MKVEFDAVKNERNMRERGIAFADAKRFEFDTADIKEDKRRDYGEVRFVATGYIGERLHVLCFKSLNRNTIRVISLRKANTRERKSYEKEKAKLRLH